MNAGEGTRKRHQRSFAQSLDPPSRLGAREVQKIPNVDEHRAPVVGGAGTEHGRPARRTLFLALGVTYRLNEVTAGNLKQVFLSDPNGILLELNYRD